MHSVVNAVLVILICAGTAFAQLDACTQESVRGTYAVAMSGTVMMPVPGTATFAPTPMSQIGLVGVDSLGRLSGILNMSVGINNFNIAHKNSTLTVNPDCSAVVYNDGEVLGTPMTIREHVLMQFFNDGKDAMTLPANDGDYKAYAIAKWRKVSPLLLDQYRMMGQCTADLVRGPHVFSFQGSAVDPATQVATPMAYYGAANFQEMGGTEGWFTIDAGGQVRTMKTVSESMVVNPDCTGVSTFSIINPATGTPLPRKGIENFIILDEGKEIWNMMRQGATAQPVGIGSCYRVPRMPAPVTIN